MGGKAVSMFQLNGAYLDPYCRGPGVWGLESPLQIHCPLVDGNGSIQTLRHDG